MGVLVGLVLAVIVLILVIAVLADQIIRLLSEDNEDDRADHAKCIAHVADVTSKRMVAVTLRDLADRYDAGRETVRIERIKREDWTPEGPALPVLWLRDWADEMDPA